MRRILKAAVAVVLTAGCGDDGPPVNPGTGRVLTLQRVAGGLEAPVLVTAPRHDSTRIFVVQQEGPIRVIRNDTMLPTPFIDLTGLITPNGEQGLLGMAFHPQYATNGRFYLNFTNLNGDTRIVRYQVSTDPDVAVPMAVETVLAIAQPFTNHNGGMIAFGPDGYLYIGMGDGGAGGDPQNHGQTMSSLLGKMLRIDVDGASGYTIPADNPFVGQAGVRGEIWSSGLRNPWRWSFDRVTGDLYIGDVGQTAREEVNVQPAGVGGANYGWRLMEGTICYEPNCSPAGLTLPAHDFGRTEACSVTGGYVYRGSIERLRGHYLYSDYCHGWIHSFRWVGGAATDHRDWTAELAPGGNISSFGEDARGEIYVVNHAFNGAVYRIVER